jgi:hypothetical protein
MSNGYRGESEHLAGGISPPPVCSLSGSNCRALEKTELPLVSGVSSEGVPLPLPMMAGKAARRVRIVGEIEQSEAANLECGLWVAVGGL